MAKGKKNDALTIEERLEAALVPEDEQPYEVPKNWCWTRISVVSDFERGITFPASAKEYEQTESNIHCLRTANIQEEVEFEDLLYVDKLYMRDNGSKLVRKDDIIMSTANSRELVGKVAYVHNVNFPITFGGFVLGIRANSIIPKYLFYDLRFEFLCGNFMGESTQTTNIANINTTTLGKYCIPLPPLPEQRRIVERIESLFSKLDEARNKAQEALDSFEERKAVLLHKAFSGELTEKWRKENQEGEWNWEEVPFGSLIIDGPQNGLYKPQTAYGEGIKILRIDCFYDGYLEPWDTLKRLQLSDSEINLYQLRIGDIVVNRVNSMPYLGKSALIRELPETCVFESNMMRISVDAQRVIPEYIIRYLNSNMGLKELRKNAKQAVNQASINQQDVKNSLIRLPEIPEQQEIIRMLDGIIEKDERARDSAIETIGMIDTLKKSILAKAFHGELGTNAPMDESAIELLKQILEV